MFIITKHLVVTFSKYFRIITHKHLKLKIMLEQAPQFIQDIDWNLLKGQKNALLEVINNIDNVQLLEKLEGIINLINEVQDYAIDICDVDENEVYDFN